jgi:hypothetical protein
MVEPALFHSFQRELTKVAKKETKPKEMRLWKKLVKSTKTPVKTYDIKDVDHRLLAMLGPHMARDKKGVKILIETPKLKDKNKYSPIAALAHEIGHTEVDKHLLGRIAQSAPARAGAAMAPTAALFASLLASTPRGKALALALPLAATVPTLGTEAAASLKGYELLKEMDATKEELKKYRTDLAKAWLTYASIPLQVGVGAIAGRALRGGVKAKL